MIPRVLVVDDHPERGPAIRRMLEFRYEVVLVTTYDEALRVLAGAQKCWAAVLCDFDLGESQPGTGIQVLELARMLDERTMRIFYTLYWVGATAQEAARRTFAHAVLDARAVDFFARLREVVEQGLEGGDDPRAPASHGPHDVLAAAAPRAPWWARSSSTLRFLADLKGAVGDVAPVYAIGEPGAGKSLARATLREWWLASGHPVPAASRDDGTTPVRFVRVPPLRERSADLEPLATQALALLAGRRAPPLLGEDLVAELIARDWSGNVRGLREAMRMAWERTGGSRPIGPQDLPPEDDRDARVQRELRNERERSPILLVLQSARSVSAAARLLDRHRPNFVRRLHVLGVERIDPGAGVDS